MWYDVIVVGILLFFTVRGAMRGVIWQLAGIAGIVLCFFFAQTISAAVGPRINLQPPLNHWVVLFGSYLFFSFVAFGLARLLNEWVEKAQMKEFNRHLGAVFGLLKGVALCLVLTFMLVTMSESAREALKDSRSAHYAAITMDRLRPLMPEKLHEALAQYIDRLDVPGKQSASGNGPIADILPGGTDPLSPNLGLPSAQNPGVTPSLGQPSGGSWWPTTTQPSQPTQPAQQPAAGDFWSQLRNSLGTDVQNAVINSLRSTDPAMQGQLTNQLAEVLKKTPPEQLPALRQQLLQQGGAQMDQLLAQWLGGTQPTSPAVVPSGQTPVQPASTGTTTSPVAPAPTSGSGGAVNARTALVREISGYMSSIPAVRTGIEQQLNAWLGGVPDSVATGVLQDLLIDLRGGGQDPDPGTNARSTVEQRILRQMQIQRVPFSTLSPEMQDRLRSAQAIFGGPL